MRGLVCIFGVTLCGFTEVTAYDFGNSLLEGGDAAVLVAPRLDFAKELKRMNLVQPRFVAQLPVGSYSDQTIEAESNDLRAALKSRKVPEEQAQEIIQTHQRERKKLSDFLQALRDYRASLDVNGVDESQSQSAGPPPDFPTFEPIPELPQEFKHYLTGAIAWHNPNLKGKDAAREAWRHLLELPPAERRYKSVWAAFMLGRSWEKEAADKAIEYFAQTREMAKHRFADSAGLAVASLGLEARIRLKQRSYEQAIELYLAQLAEEDPTAVESLRIVCHEALQGDLSALVPLARNPRTQRALTAYATSLAPVKRSSNGEEEGDSDSCRWLAAVEKAEVRDTESAQKLALLAYQNNETKLAARWIERAQGSPVAEWLRAKLLLRQGKVDRAKALLSHVAPLFPLRPHNPTNELAAECLQDSLVVEGDYTWQVKPAGGQILGELGVLLLARREYVPALDALLRSGFWPDAAYVAERVLSLEELQAYVDRDWPSVAAEQGAKEVQEYGDDSASPAVLRKQIRYLLARRLTREIHGDQARDYYPGERLGEFDALTQALRIGWDESLPGQTRAQSLFEAAIIARTNGMELLATEVEPDWHICGGDFQETPIAELRRSNSAAKYVMGSSDEWNRAAGHHADPEARFHYRYQAASLAWEAAKLLPNDSPQTAYILWRAGTWLKGRDPQTAQLFYQSLVWRNRHTTLGAEADRRRWFPPLDEDGNVVPREQPSLSGDAKIVMQSGVDHQAQKQPDIQGADQVLLDILEGPTEDPAEGLAEVPDSDSADAENYYLVRNGDSLGSILQALPGITFDDLLAANPELDSARLKVGQKVFLPTRAP